MKKIILSILITISLMPALSFAQVQGDNYKLLAPLPCIDGVGAKCTSNTISSINFNDYISYIFKFAIAASVFLAVIMIMIGGFQYMTSEIPSMKSDAKGRIQDAIIGLIMVLASYLILQTIDPRLVEVNTTIPKIQIPKEDLVSAKSFAEKLSEDLKKMTSEKQLKVIELENKKMELEKQRKAIENELLAFNASSNAGDYTKRDEIEVRLAKVKSEFAKADSEQIKTIAEGLGTSSFRSAYEAIQNPLQANRGELDKYAADTVPNTLVNGKLPTNSPNELQNNYNKRINEIAAIDSEAARVLSLQRNFYTTQVKEEIELNTNITKHGGVESATGGQGAVVKIDNSRYLGGKMREYEANIADAQKVANSGLTEVEYKNIMQTRVDRIKKALGPNTPTSDGTNGRW